jgi:hypothetical protein
MVIDSIHSSVMTVCIYWSKVYDSPGCQIL